MKIQVHPICCALPLLTMVGVLAPAADSQPPRHARLNVIASQSLMPGVNNSDAIASMMVFVAAVAKNRGFVLDSRVEILDSVDDIARRLRDKWVDVMMLDSRHHLALSAMNLIEVVGAGSAGGQLGAYPYLLLIRDSPGTAVLADLRGKRIVVSSRTKSDLGLLWLETLLAGSHLARAERFFVSPVITNRPAACILPLFFGKIDACVVDRASWDLARDLNPQLSKLKVIARSESYIEGAVAVPTYPHPFRTEMFQTMLDLHLTPGGQQLLTLMKTGPIIRARKEDFESVRVLLNGYTHLPAITLRDGGKNESRGSEP